MVAVFTLCIIVGHLIGTRSVSTSGQRRSLQRPPARRAIANDSRSSVKSSTK